MDKETKREIILDNYQNPMNKGLKEDDVFNLISERVIEDYENKISIAHGYSSKIYSKNDKNFRKDIYKEADDKMYEMKKRQHEELAKI